jgi:DNA-binding transcriptional LysR family regulator
MPIAARFAGHLHARYPGVSLTVRSMSSQDIESGLENLSLDLGLGYTERLISRAAKLVVVPQYTEHYFLLRRTDKPARTGLRMVSQPTSWADAAKLPLCLLTPEMHNRTIVDAAFKQIGIHIQPVIETNSILTLGLTVLVGDVCSILPGALVAVLHGYAELEAVPLVGPDVMTPIGFMCAGQERPSNVMRVTLALAHDPAWLAHMNAHVGLLGSKSPT